MPPFRTAEKKLFSRFRGEIGFPLTLSQHALHTVSQTSSAPRNSITIVW